MYLCEILCIMTMIPPRIYRKLNLKSEYLLGVNVKANLYLNI